MQAKLTIISPAPKVVIRKALSAFKRCCSVLQSPINLQEHTAASCQKRYREIRLSENTTPIILPTDARPQKANVCWSSSFSPIKYPVEKRYMKNPMKTDVKANMRLIRLQRKQTPRRSAKTP